MAINGQPGDIEFIKDYRVIKVPTILAVLYKHPTNITGLQFMAISPRLGTIIGGVTYRVLIGTAEMHVENAKLPGVTVLTKDMALMVPLVVTDFANALTKGDPDAMFAQLQEIQLGIQPRFNITA